MHNDGTKSASLRIFYFALCHFVSWTRLSNLAI